MPYQNASQLPSSFHQFSPRAQNAAVQAFNSAYQQHGSEPIAFATAFHAAHMAERAALHGGQVPGIQGLPRSLR